MKKQTLKQKLITTIAIPTIGLSGLFYTGCKKSEEDHSKNIDYSQKSEIAPQVDSWMSAIKETYGEDVTVHEFLQKGIAEGKRYAIIKKELKDMYVPTEKVTKANFTDITCYFNQRLNELEEQ